MLLRGTGVNVAHERGRIVDVYALETSSHGEWKEDGAKAGDNY